MGIFVARFIVILFVIKNQSLLLDFAKNDQSKDSTSITNDRSNTHNATTWNCSP